MGWGFVGNSISALPLFIAYFATANGDDPPRGGTAYRLIEEELAARLAAPSVRLRR